MFTQRGTLGQVSVVPSANFNRYLVSQSQMKLNVNREIADPLFIYYVFSTPEQQDYIRQNAIQTGVPHTNLGILCRTSIPLPSLSEQRAIVHILGTLDDKIELNRRMNETLEAMACALFKSWFVDFDPVRAKAEGRDPGLPKPLADLFPDRLVDSELGDIPEGWEVGPLDSVLVLQRGFDLPATERTSGAYPVLAASGPSGTHNEFMVRGPGVTTGRSGLLGKVFFVAEDF
ncbi:MAG: restriction endonuclease subunit S [Proteobacteria bacterium]|nr:restriction endonuclease subunit S [Pseudomonadota bacterium]